MKKAFKIFSAIIIGWSVYSIIVYLLLLTGMSSILGAAASATGATAAVVGFVGTIFNIITVVGLGISALMLYMGICGVRGLVDKCEKIAKGLLIFEGICIGILIFGGNVEFKHIVSTGLLAVYYYMACKYPVNDFDDSFYY